MDVSLSLNQKTGEFICCPWRNIHHFFSAISIILVGIHLGLHWNFVSNMFKRMIKLCTSPCQVDNEKRAY
ncbi:DUF4405 domain-containing protein [Parageobacillus thermoglucosidasius]|uniref:DUF4405 domain-containing protein n=1 Tax=Parageobacillus thermoglucosidasius TaxID=1426 RepID=UPI000907C016|nr:DUF4405 domain-containing protein [Parageobacillus thermoglucosidasius]REK53583.1 MAG: DUF4405 domain-containing protein [Geobacillus sp.]